MPRDKTENHEKIVAAAYQEFLDYGFTNASMRRIASACEMSVAGLYKHFPSKEDMFAALVEPTYEGLKKKYEQSIKEELGSVQDSFSEERWDKSSESVWVTEYVYEHFCAFKLLICRSKGTRFENYVHELALMEEESTRRYLQRLRKLGVKVKRVSQKEFHLFVTSCIQAVFLPVEHDFSREEAISYAKHLDQYNVAGWKSLLLK